MYKRRRVPFIRGSIFKVFSVEVQISFAFFFFGFDHSMSSVLIDFFSKESTSFASNDLAVLSTALKVAGNSLLSIQELLQRLSLTLASSSFREVASELFLSFIFLATSTSGKYNAQILEMLEKGASSVDRLVKDACKLYTEHSSPVLEMNSVLDAVCNCLILLSVLLSRSDFTAEAVLSFLDNNIYASTSLLCHAFTKVCGTKPGYAPLFCPFFTTSSSDEVNEKPQFEVPLKIIRVLHQLTSWKMYDYLQKVQVVSRKCKDSSILSLAKASGPFRSYLSVISKKIMETTFLSEWSMYFSILQVKYRDRHTNFYHEFVKECAVLAENLLILTDCFCAQLRKCIMHSEIVQKIFLIFLCWHCDNLNDENSSIYSSVVVVIRALATITFRSKGIQECISKEESTLVKLFAILPGEKRGTLKKDEKDKNYILYSSLLLQLTRMAVNVRLYSFLPIIEAKFNSMTSKRKDALFSKLILDQRCQFAPVEVSGPFFQELLQRLKVGPPTSASGDDYSNALLEATKTSRSSRKRRYERLKRRKKLQESKSMAIKVDATEAEEVKESAIALDVTGDTEVLNENEEEDSDLADESLELHSSASCEVDEKNDLPVEIDLSKWRKGAPPSRIPLDFICSLTHRIIQSVAVLSPEGYVFDRVSIMQYLEENDRCPISGKPLKAANLIVDEKINEKLQTMREKLLDM